MLATLFTIAFALACLATFLCAMREQWRNARLAAATIAVLSFFLALLTAKVK